MKILARLSKLSILAALPLLYAGQAYALSTQLTLVADTDITPGTAELVTFGLPLAQGDVVSLSEIKVSVNGAEVSAYVAAGLTYHWSDNSIRSVTIQIGNVDMTGGPVPVTVTDEGATVSRASEQPHSNGWTNASPTKSNLPYPRVFALHDPAYLSTTGFISPYKQAPATPDAFENFQVGQFNSWARDLDYSTSTNAYWLFDRSSAMFKAYATTGRVEFLKEAFLSKQFYFSYVKNDGVAPAPAGGDGCFTYGSTACADGKYIAPQQAKLALALVGDHSQWDNDLIVNMALQADLGWNQYGTRDPFDAENEGFTERGAGIAGLAEINAYEMTGDATLLAHLNERISSLKDMQQSMKSWDTNYGWTPKSGGFTHNIDVHEGNASESTAQAGNTNARGFSAWMSENIADFLWQTYWITGNSDIPGMLAALANAVNTYGFTSSYDPLSGTFTKKAEFASSNPHTQGCNTTGDETDLLYFASAYADSTRRSTGDWWSWYSDNHNIETVLILGTGYYFETDAARKEALNARIEKIIEGWVNSNCSNVFGHVYRLWNWQHRSNSVRTWEWIKSQGTPSPVSQWSFENVTASVLDNASLNSYYRFDAIWSDFNNDGLYDPMIVAHNHVVDEVEPTRLWVQNNDNSHTFAYVPHSTANYILDNGYAAIRGSRDMNNLDLNGDGKEDFILLDGDAQAAFYVNGTPDGEHTPYFASKSAVCGTKDYCDVADINGDGRLDIIHNDRRIVDLLNGTELYPQATPSVGTAGTMLIYDLEEDGWPDIVQSNTGGYWRNVGGGLSYVDAGFSTAMFTRSQVIADFDNDGDLDFFGTSGGFSDPGDGPHLYRNNGNGTFTDVIQGSGIADKLGFAAYWTRNGNAVAADFDNDGLIDIAVAGTKYSPSVELIRNLGGLTFEMASIDLGPANMSNSAKPRVAVADYDNDGLLDIVKTQSVTNAGIWRNTTTTINHWMQVRVRGEDNNTDGLGTCLRWYAPGTHTLLAHYHINSNHSHAQKHPHAGLGSQTQVDLEVRFPHDGPTYAYQGLATNQEVIVYPNGCLVANWTPGSGWPLTPPPSNACIQPATYEPTPNISPPSDITVNADSASGTPATNTAIAAFLTGATAIDEVDGAISVTNDAPDLFPAGTTTPVHFIATNSLDRTATASANVTVRAYDIEPPVITPPADITVDAESGSGTLSTHPAIAAFLAEATAIDNVDNTVDVTNNAPGQFPEGVTTEVIFSAADNAGNTATASSYVTVNAYNNDEPDTTPPVVTPPTDITINAETPSGTYSSNPTIAAFLARATAIDNVDGTVDVSNNTPNLLPAGVTTEIVFSATDNAGNSTTATAYVTVNAFSTSGADTTLPVVTPPSDITVDAETASGTSSNHIAIAAFLAEATAIDNIDGAVSVTNNAPDLFPAGKTTEVIFSAADGAGNIGTARAHVTVSAYSISVDGVYGGGGTFDLSLMVLLLFFGILHSKRKYTIHL